MMNGRNQGIVLTLQQVGVTGVAEAVFYAWRMNFLFEKGAALRRDQPVVGSVNDECRDVLPG